MKTDYYPVTDYIPMRDRDDLSVVVRMDGNYYNLIGGLVPVKIWAVPTGEFRAPKRGEWYISEDLTAHRAESDLTTEYHLAKLTRLRFDPIDIKREL